MAIYRGMDRATLDAAYDNRAAVPAFPALAAERKQRSERVRATRRLMADLRYGPGERERLDYFASDAPGAPVLVFIHGGYWQSNDKDASSFLVEGPLALGFGVALVEYTLAPEATLAQMAGEVARALGWLTDHAAELGADPRRIIVTGHSAGGHLTAMVLGHPAVAGAVAISGLFDLEPIRLCYLNDKLGLDATAARRLSPLHHLPVTCPPLVVAVGAAELPELQRQSADYAAALRGAGLPVQHLPLPGHDHFTILEEIERPDGRLCRLFAELARTPT